MARFSLCLGVLLLAFPSAHAQSAKPVLSEETWHAAYFEGVRAGYVHTTVHKVVRDEQKLLRTTRNLHLSVKRYNKVVPLRVEMTSEEKADGKVVSLSFTQFLDKDKQLTLAGSVQGEYLVLSSPPPLRGRKLPWNPAAIGLYRQDRLYQARKVKPGVSLSYVSYELALQAPLTIRATVKELETIDVLEASKEKGKLVITRTPRKLLRVEQLADKFKVGKETIQLPRQITWLDSDLLPVRYEQEFPGVGSFTLYQTTKAAAVEPGIAPELLPDLGLNTTIALKKTIDRPYETTRAIYRINFKDDDPASTFARDGRQVVRNVKGKTFELHVRAVREPVKIERPGSAGKEYLKSSYFLDSDDSRIQAIAKRAVGKETDPWRQARLLEKWVFVSMKPTNAIGFATASQVARDLAGDCRQHAMLTAALCRAAKIPARTAVGVIYVREPGRSPMLVFHMWTEVWVKGQWLGLDATLGLGGIGACHLKITDHSWADTQTLAPLLPVARVLGKLSVEVVDAR
jgi:hypothetical protein